MDLLTGSLRHYSWGSRELIAQLRGDDAPASAPEAEVWFGAHPAGSATIGGRELVDIIGDDLDGELGARARAQFGDRLPFLLKLLAADEPLSLQAHPSLDQAREGFARENAAGIPLGADHRNYKDDNHKPELIVALTEFEAMAGFRPLAETVALLHSLDCPALERYLSMLSDGTDEENDLRALFTTWITIPAAARTELIGEIVAAARQALDRGALPAQHIDALRNIIDLHERYPFDVGILGALLLNKFTLQPGEALYLDAGQLHAYVRGLGVEIMANSDNVLRGGLTPKHVDVPELVHVLTFNAVASPQVQPVEDNGWQLYPTPIAEFSLRTAWLAEPKTVSSDGPAIVLCTAGEVTAQGADNDITLRPGTAAWIAASDGAITLSASGPAPTQVFLAEV